MERPCVFGFTTMQSISNDARIELQLNHDTPLGSSTAMIVGYDDLFQMSTKGAFQIRATWGNTWGDNGFGWLDYQYLENDLMKDIWTVFP